MTINYMYILQFIGVMTSMILADVSWTYYFIKVEERKSLSAGIWSALIVVFGIFTTINYVEDRSLVVAAIIGAFAGTFLAVEIKKRNETKKKIH